MNNYKYDIAFSFCGEDEQVAKDLYVLLENKVNCFIYFDKQIKLAGKDGEIEFQKVFEEESRIVAVIYQKNWGKTNWTRIEETGIRNRGYEEGYDFVTFIPIDNSEKPKWLPKNRLWIGLHRWGYKEAAAVIEARVQEHEGEIKVESIADKTVRIEQERRKQKEIEQLLDSEEGLEVAIEELGILGKEINKIVSEIKEKSRNWHLSVIENNQEGWNLGSYGHQLSFQWNQQYSNSLQNSHLLIGVFKGYYNKDGYGDPLNPPKDIKLKRYNFSVNHFDQNGWLSTQNKSEFLSSRSLAERWIDIFIDHAQKGKY